MYLARASIRMSTFVRLFFILPLRRSWGIEFHFRAVWVEVKRDRLKTTAWEARLFWT